jgi:hypothetical protein
MADMEKVIKALECRKNADKRCGNPCEETGMCHYATAVRDINGEIYRPFICDRERICTDALALLKEQKQEIEFLKAMQLQTVHNMTEEDIGNAVARVLGLKGR